MTVRRAGQRAGLNERNRHLPGEVDVEVAERVKGGDVHPKGLAGGHARRRFIGRRDDEMVGRSVRDVNSHSSSRK